MAMLRTLTAATFTAVTFGLVALACSKDTPPATSPQAAGYPSGQYPQTPPGTYPQQPPGTYAQQPGAYPQQPPGTYPSQPAQPGAPALPGTPTPGAGAAMATPNQFAFACTSDATCGLAHCNTQYGKCAFPCANSAVDCIQGASCNTMTGLCVPGGAP